MLKSQVLRHFGSTSGQGAEAVGAASYVGEETTELTGAEKVVGAMKVSAVLLVEAVH